MNTLAGKQAEEFMLWLDEAKYYLPIYMTIDEARELYERKVKDEEERRNEKAKKSV